MAVRCSRIPFIPISTKPCSFDFRFVLCFKRYSCRAYRIIMSVLNVSFGICAALRARVCVVMRLGGTPRIREIDSTWKYRCHARACCFLILASCFLLPTSCFLLSAPCSRSCSCPCSCPCLAPLWVFPHLSVPFSLALALAPAHLGPSCPTEASTLGCLGAVKRFLMAGAG